MVEFSVVVHRALRSGQDRTAKSTTGVFLQDPSLQAQLHALYAVLRKHAACGDQAEREMNGVKYLSLFDAGWAIEVHVQLLLTPRHLTAQADADNVWRPIQNALAFPANDLASKLERPAKGNVCLVVAPSDRQFGPVRVELLPDPCTEVDTVILKFRALPPPNLVLSLWQGVG